MSVETAQVIKERDALEARVAELQAAAAGAQQQAAAEQYDGDWRPLGLVQKLVQQQQEAEALQVPPSPSTRMCAPVTDALHALLPATLLPAALLSPRWGSGSERCS